MKVKDLIKLLESEGWRQARMRGSHRQFKHAVLPGTVTVSGKPNVDIPSGTLNSILKQAGPQAVSIPMQYTVIVEKGATSWGSYVPDLPGCIAAGNSRDEVLQLIREAIEFHIEGLIEQGQPVPQPRSSSELVEISAA